MDWQQPITNFSPVLQRTTNSFTPFSLRFLTKNFFPEVLEEGRWKDNVAREPGSATHRQRERAFPQVFINFPEVFPKVPEREQSPRPKENHHQRESRIGRKPERAAGLPESQKRQAENQPSATDESSTLHPSRKLGGGNQRPEEILVFKWNVILTLYPGLRQKD